MTRSASIYPLGSEFDKFLFAPIGEDRNGMLVSVLSALVRLDVDPWQEAANLARLPGEAATQRLASLIASLPDEPSARPDLGTIAGRLVALLPRPINHEVASGETLLGSVTKDRAIKYMIFMVFILVPQWLVTGSQPPAEGDDARPSAFSTASPPTPPPISGQ